MRLKTQKHIRKLIKLYKINYNFRSPYKVILDGNFIKKCLDKEFKFKEKVIKINIDTKIYKSIMRKLHNVLCY